MYILYCQWSKFSFRMFTYLLFICHFRKIIQSWKEWLAMTSPTILFEFRVWKLRQPYTWINLYLTIKSLFSRPWFSFSEFSSCLHIVAHIPLFGSILEYNFSYSKMNFPIVQYIHEKTQNVQCLYDKDIECWKYDK